MKSLLFIDIEASGLGQKSFPIEVGWASESGSGAFLIRPEPEWDDWDPISSEIHGISLESLFEHGISAIEAASRFLAMASGRVLVSDAPQFDSMWLGEVLILSDVDQSDWPRLQPESDILFEETARLLDVPTPRGVSVRTERLRCLAAGNDTKRAFHGIRHRAEPDAQRMLAGYLAVREAVTSTLVSWLR